MASSFLVTWRTLTSDSASRASCHFFSTIPSSYIKRQRFCTFSLDPSSDPSTPSSSYPSCSTSQTAIFRHRRTRKPLDLESEKLAIAHSSDSNTFEKKESKVDKQKFSLRGLKRVARKKPLWRKVLFASEKIRSIVLLNVITIIYASDIPVVKGVETIMDPAAFSAVRFVISAIPFLPFVFQARDDVKTRNAGIELGFWISLAYLIEAIGLVTSDAGRASFISLFTVIAVALLDGMLGAIIPARTWFGVLMSALGVAMLECSGSPPNLGDLLNFLSAIFFGVHMLRTEHISRMMKKENFLPLLGYEVCVVAMISMMWLLIGGYLDGVNNSNQSTWTWTELWDWIVAFPWLPALYTGVFSTGFCSLIEIAAMREVSATETAIIYGLEPLWGAGFAWFLLGERWGTLGWIGATLVLGGSLMVQMFGSSPTQKSVEAEDDANQNFGQIIKNGLSTSPVVVRSRKDVRDIL
ncbi:hypothetical protein FNV43_RR19935 [Rhamnella rubrinervis]|uniref:EamA domain-containing protein n=1 Tax=Rhamnella rubrinervis TaxID=2594499 RepID=A0A8K0E5H7_9ROSA|nr:hypothetical protein FNV43_RR19935 [Rhamnella rubrinervis]